MAILFFDAILYLLLHDFTKLNLFSHFQHNDFSFYKEIHSRFVRYFLKYKFFVFIKNYFVDFLWFVSIIFVYKSFFHKKSDYFIIFSIGLISELSQLFIPQAGTFDFVDLGIYFVTAFLFLVLDMKKIFFHS